MGLFSRLFSKKAGDRDFPGMQIIDGTPFVDSTTSCREKIYRQSEYMQKLLNYQKALPRLRFVKR